MNGGWQVAEKREHALLCIPTLDAGDLAAKQVAALAAQSCRPADFLVIDSSSRDATASVYREAGADVVTIPRAEFDHGATRNLALSRYPQADVLVYLTQDAIPADTESLARLMARLDDPEVGAVHGRQLPREGADAVEAHARLFNYPEHSNLRRRDDIPEYGIKTVFLSNSFAAYRRYALESVGGFPAGGVMNEDMYAAARMLLAGWKLAYAADAAVRHSHPYTPSEEFRRYFDIGTFIARNRWLIEAVGSPGGEGARYLKSEMRYLLDKDPLRIPAALLRDAAKLLGMGLGRREAAIPLALKRRLGMNRAFWNAQDRSSVSPGAVLDSTECRSPKA